MHNIKFREALIQIVKDDPRYAPEAYEFVSKAVVFTMLSLSRDKSPSHHISGQELLDGFRRYAIQEFGPMAGEIMKSWGFSNSSDVGNVVFNLVNRNLLGKTENDSLSDFKNGLDFERAFSEPFKTDKIQQNNPPIIA
ncbi:MAG: Minf_1886 family protein [Lentisphaerota bacterium]